MNGRIVPNILSLDYGLTESIRVTQTYGVMQKVALDNRTGEAWRQSRSPNSALGRGRTVKVAAGIDGNLISCGDEYLIFSS